MKRLFTFLTVIFLGLPVSAQVDSTALARIDKYIDAYAGALTFEDMARKKGECDFMIESVADSLVRNHIGNHLYDYYRDSKVMGEEEVAIYLWDKWFSGKELVFEPVKGKSSEDRYFDARMFADFNRATLIGEKAPVLNARKPGLGRLRIPEKGVPAILYFFDTSCGKCKIESAVLPSVLKDRKEKLVFYAFYCGSDRKSWKKFRKEFRTGNDNIRLVHVWDPKMDTDYLRLYGVISTPRLYVTTAEGVVLGRRLEVENLPQILDVIQKM